LHTVHVRVNDAATGEPTPVRIRFADGEGKYLAPFGRLTDFATGMNEDVGGNVQHGRESYAYIDGTCEINLPADPCTVHIFKGPEYRPVHHDFQLGPGKIALRLKVERWSDLRSERWYSGDTNVQFLSPHAALLEGRAEDVAVVNVLASLCQRYGADRIGHLSIPGITDFSGQQPALEAGGCMVVVNTLNRGADLGTLSLLNCHRVVFPLSAVENGDYWWTLDDWCDQCHRKGGLVLWPHFDACLSGPGYRGADALANAVLGKVDAVEVDALRWCTEERTEWYRLLNCGLRVPLVGGSHKVSNAIVLGRVRTYARLQEGEDFTYKHWIEAVRAGRTFVTNGPLLTFTVNELDPGAVIDQPADVRKVRIQAHARSILPFERLEVIVNGEVLAGAEASGAPAEARLEGELEVPGTCWLGARCWGDVGVAAHTSPVYVQVAGQSLRPDAIVLAPLLERLDNMLAWIADAPFDGDRTRTHLTETLQAARTELAHRASGIA
jgi:hypothetical protein